ncbi:uncharacterized protein PADG_12523 [Paracoccidioides brasiliensis Pb18]|uniref:Uncharacterized protein n=1 Tax=Paracoccidioides brasiliensis (strain Pb18) TaxID=502780 RepID=A0A0A0HSW0_PARBD|nr:uncharacterized protein PADG_12523 [Paracoccidioides brasiliensis Pb18]KGM91403.1 hypothetical protein PADG_12523 [Paracoccidioides brasiliensis Pb18]
MSHDRACLGIVPFGLCSAVNDGRIDNRSRPRRRKHPDASEHSTTSKTPSVLTVSFYSLICAVFTIFLANEAERRVAIRLWSRRITCAPPGIGSLSTSRLCRITEYRDYISGLPVVYVFVRDFDSQTRTSSRLSLVLQPLAQPTPRKLYRP